MSQPIDRAFVEILPDLDSFVRTLSRRLDDVFDDMADKVDDAVDRAERQFDNLADDMAEHIEDAVDSIDRDLDRVDGRDIEIEVDVDTGDAERRLDVLRERLAGLASIVGRSLKVSLITVAILALTAALTNATAGVASFLAALAPAAGILVVLPAVIAGVVLVTKTLTLALQGVSDAIKAGFEGDLEKFNEALKELSPSAQRLVKNLVALKPKIDALGDAVQERFFKPFVDDMERLSGRVLPILNAQLPRLSGALGLVTEKLVQSVSQEQLFTGFKDVVDGLVVGFNRLAPAIAPVIRAFGILLSVGASFLPDLLGGIGSLAQGFAQFIEQASRTGQLQEFLKNAIQTIGQLLGILGQVGSIVSSIFSAMTAGGGGVLDIIENLLRTVSAFLNSAEGQQGLLSFFQILNTLGRSVNQALGILLIALAKGFQALAPAAEPLGRALVAIATAVAPLLPLLGEALSLTITELSGIFIGLTKVLGPIISVISGELITAFRILAPAATKVFAALAPLAGRLGIVLIEALTPLAQLIPIIAQAFTEALLPELPRLTEAFTELIPVITQLAAQLSDALIEAIIEILPHLPEMISAAVDLAIAMTKLIAAVAPLAGVFTAILPIIVKILTTFNVGVMQVRLLILIIEGLAAAFEFLVTVGSAFPGQLMRVLRPLSGLVSTLFSTMFANVRRIFTTAISGIVLLVSSSLVGRIFSILSPVRQRLVSLFAGAFSAARGVVVSWIGSIINAIATVPGRIAAFAGRMFSAGAALGRAIGSGLANIGGFAADIGRRIVNTVRSGVNSVIGSINRGLSSIDAVLPGSLPRLPFLARGGVTLGPAVIGDAGKELALPLESDRTRKLLEGVLPKNLGGSVIFGPNSVVVSFQGVVPTEQEAFTTGRAVGSGIADILARRNARLNVRAI